MSLQGACGGIVFAWIGPAMISKISKTAALKFSLFMATAGCAIPLFESLGEWIWSVAAIQALGFNAFVLCGFGDSIGKLRRRKARMDTERNVVALGPYGRNRACCMRSFGGCIKHILPCSMRGSLRSLAGALRLENACA